MNLQNKEISMETILKNKENLLTGRIEYFTELVKVAVSLSNEIANEPSDDVKQIKSMLVAEIITMLTASWRNTLPFNLFVSEKAAVFAKSLGVDDLRKYDYSLKFGMDEVASLVDDPDFLAVASHLSEQDVAKLNKALAKDDKAVNSNVMLQWEHAYTGRMFTADVTELISNLSQNNASDDEISESVKELVEKQAIVWILKTENYEIIEKGFKDVRLPNWESAYKECGIELSPKSKEDYLVAFGKEW